MNISVSKLPKSMIEITGEIPAGDFDVFYQKAVKKLSTDIEIPGFRPGNAPENILKNHIGENKILEEAAEIALQETYPKILEENEIDAIGKPEITVTKIARNNPLGFKIKTAVIPEFDLPDYKSTARKVLAESPEKIEVSEKETNDALEYLRKTHAAPEASLPELNDEFAKSLGKFETLEDLKKTIRENILLEKQAQEKEKTREKILGEIASKTSIDLPFVLIESQKKRMMDNLKENLESLKIEWDKYLAKIKKSEDDLKKGWQEEAEKRVRYGLILDKLALKENIRVSKEEIDEKSKEIAARYNADHHEKVDETLVKEYAYGIIRNEKVFQKLETG